MPFANRFDLIALRVGQVAWIDAQHESARPAWSTWTASTHPAHWPTRSLSAKMRRDGHHPDRDHQCTDKAACYSSHRLPLHVSSMLSDLGSLSFAELPLLALRFSHSLAALSVISAHSRSPSCHCSL